MKVFLSSLTVLDIQNKIDVPYLPLLMETEILQYDISMFVSQEINKSSISSYTGISNQITETLVQYADGMYG